MELAPSPAPRRRISSLISWIVILGLTVFLAYRSASSPSSDGAQEMINESRARLAGLFAMQLKTVSGNQRPTFMLGPFGNGERLITDLEQEAQSDADRIRSVIVRGEFHDGEDALKTLDRWFPSGATGETKEDAAALRQIYNDGPKTLDEGSRKRLIARYKDLGLLALSYGIDPKEEPRKSLQASSLTFILRLLAVAAGFLFLVALVVGAFILICVWAAQGKLVPAYVRGNPSGVFVEGFALYFVLFLGLSLALRFLGGSGVVSLWLALPIPLAVAAWTMWRGRLSWQQVREAFGWNAGRGLFREVSAGLGGYLAGLVFVAIGGLATLILVRLTGARPASPVVEELQGGAWHLLGVFSAACIVAPVLEETMFRGVLFHHFRERWGWWISAPSVALIFAAIHPQGWVAIPVLSSIAIVLAAIREWRGSLIASIVAHACNNFLALAAALLLLG